MKQVRHGRRTQLALVIVGLAPLVAFVAACTSGSRSASSGGRITVVAAENFWGDVARQVGGSHVTVSSIISDPNTDPHTYETNAQDAAEISGAQLVIKNGLGYDDFIDKILATGGNSNRRVLSVQQALGLNGSNINPHVWYDTARLPAVANQIAAQLAAIDPAHKRDYQSHAAQFKNSLKPLLAVINQIKQRYGGDPIAYTERVPGYLVHAAGLHLATPASFSQALEDGNDPSPQDTAAFEAAITNHKVKVLLYNSQVVDAQAEQIKQLAQSSGVPIVGVSETMPKGATFQSWQLQQDKALLTALRNASQ
jgi:zinc/manganese transport system substrate-binding protein